MPSIYFTVNSEPHTTDTPLSVAMLLQQLGHDARKLAVEVNEQVVPRSEHEQHQITEGDRVEIVTLVGGGEPLDTPWKVGTSRSIRGSSQAQANTPATN